MNVLSIGATKLIAEPIKDLLEKNQLIVNETNLGCYSFFDCHVNKENIDNNDELVINLLIELISSKLQAKWIEKLLFVHYDYFDEHEHEQILLHAEKIIHETLPAELGIFSQLADYLKTNDELIVDGFVRFRLKDYWNYLCNVVDNAVDAYLIEREYLEFVKLLRYFVELQEPKVELVNVVLLENGKFQLFDDNHNLIKSQYVEGLILELASNELDFEDLLISALITIAPQDIILHAYTDQHVIETIISIFNSRVILCSGCILCDAAAHKRGFDRRGK